MNLVYLSSCVALIPPTKFWFNPSLNFGEDNVTLLWVLWRPSLKAEWKDYCNSESQYGLDAYQSAQCDICHVYIFRMAVMAVWHLGYQKGTILAILNLHVAPMHLARFSFTPTFTLRIRTTCTIVQESSISKISPKKIALFFPVCSAEINGLCYIGRGLEGIMWNISLQLFLINLGQWLMRRYHLKIFLS